MATIDLTSLKEVDVYEIYVNDYDGRKINTESLHTSKILHDIDFRNGVQDEQRVKTKLNGLFFESENGTIYALREVGKNLSFGRNENNELRQDLTKTLTPEQFDYLKNNPL